MNKRLSSIICLAILAVLISGLLAACGSGNTATPTGAALDGQSLMLERCSVCHSMDRVISAHKTADQWKTTLDRMVARGAQLTPEEEQTLLDYLAANFK